MRKYILQFTPFIIAILLHVFLLAIFIGPNISSNRILTQSINTKTNTITFNLKNSVINPIKKVTEKEIKSRISNISKLPNDKSILKNDENQIPSSNSANIEVANSIEFINFENPEFPAIARKKGIEGSVKLKIDFDGNGNVINTQILESNHHDILINSVLTSVKKWKIKSNHELSLVKTFEFKLNP